MASANGDFLDFSGKTVLIKRPHRAIGFFKSLGVTQPEVALQVAA